MKITSRLRRATSFFLALGLAAALSAPASALTKLKLYGADLDFDPNGNIWHVTSKICNMDTAPSGTLNYELRLYTQPLGTAGQYFRVAGRKMGLLNPTRCWNRTLAFKVTTKDLAPGTYYIVLAVGEWDGGKFVGRPIWQFDKTFIKN